MTGRRRWMVGLLLAGAVIGIVLRAGEVRGFAALLRQAQPGWLLAALALQLSTYVTLALSWREVLIAGEGRRFSLAALVWTAFSKLFADQALPTAGMGGNVLLLDQLSAVGASRGTAMAVLLLSIRGYYAAYLALALFSLLLLWLHGQATPLMVGVVTSFVIVALSIPGLALWLRRRGSKPLPRAMERIRPIAQLLQTVSEAPTGLVGDRRLLIRVALLNALIFAADILTLQVCLRALGEQVALSTALIAFTLASIVVTLGPLPFGLGTFEATAISVLHLLGVPLEASLSATLLFRFLVLWLPLVPGLLQLRQLAKKKRTMRRTQDGTK